YRSDIFSLGVIGFQWFVDDVPDHILDDRPNHAAEGFVSLLDRRITEAKHVAPSLRELLREMIRVDARIRPTASDVVSHLASNEDDILASVTEDEIRKPLLLTIAPDYLARFIQIDDWKELPSDED